MVKSFLVAGAVFGLVGVILGAFGAHGLKALIDVDSLLSFETGVRYQMYHALLLLILGVFLGQRKTTEIENSKSWKVVFYLIVFGIILFSGSIYLLATNALSGFDFTRIALLTPLGGTLLIVGWSVVVWRFLRTL